MTTNNKLITILGPTATGKTRLAALLAGEINGEVISADSRQVYKGMNIGTGKDLEDYIVGNNKITHHLIDIAEPGEEYDLFRFITDFKEAYQKIINKNKKAIMCGGSGMYLEAVILNYNLNPAPISKQIRKELENKEFNELVKILAQKRTLHNVTDISEKSRLIRALEIEIVKETQKGQCIQPLESFNHIVMGIELPREEIRNKITQRLHQRLKEGMVEEVKALVNNGVSFDKLRYYGLEYKYVADLLTGETSFDQMKNKLNTAIHQFAKRQMTWYRRMEKRGVKINWIDGKKGDRERLNDAMKTLQSNEYQHFQA